MAFFVNPGQVKWRQLKQTKLKNAQRFYLTLFQLGGGPLWPGRSEMVCHFHRVWARFTKIHDFVPFNV